MAGIFFSYQTGEENLLDSFHFSLSTSNVYLSKLDLHIYSN